MGFVLHQRGSAQPSYTNQQGSYSTNMSFWQENYAFIKEVYEMRHMKMAEWMENVEKSIARIMADKVYTSSEFKRERDTFNSLCKDLERAEVRKWLQQILEILMAERAKDQKMKENDKLDTLIKKHEELIPNVQKTAVMVDLYWKCYAYGDELKPHVEFLDGIMLSSTRDIAPSCLENVDELIERQEKSLSQLDSKRNIVTDLIAKGKVILQNPDKPKFLEGNVNRIQDGWEDTKKKAQDRLQLLTETRTAFIGYAEESETIANEFDISEEEIKKVKKIFNLEAANADLNKRQDIFKKTDDTINGLFNSINNHYNTMAITIPDDKVLHFDKSCLNYLKVLDAANGAAQKMTTHKEADDEVAGLRERYTKVKSTSDTWVKKCEILVKEWTLLDNTVTELNSWVAKDKSAEGENQFSLEKMESTLGELKNIFKQKEKLVEGL